MKSFDYLNIFTQAKQDDRKLSRVALMVSVKGIKMSDLETGNIKFDFSIYRSDIVKILKGGKGINGKFKVVRGVGKQIRLDFFTSALSIEPRLHFPFGLTSFLSVKI